MKKTNLLTKTLLVAASLLSVAPVAKAYDQSGWYTDQNSWGGFNYVGATGSYSGTITLNPFAPAIRAGVYNASGVDASWGGNDYGNYVLGIKVSVSAAYMENWMDLGQGNLYNSIAYDSQNGDHSMLGGYSNTYLLPLNATYVRYHYRYDQSDEEGNFYASPLEYFERSFQVARTGPGFDGASATSAFASDNESYGSNYATYSNLNVLRTQSYDGEGGSVAAPVGSVVRNGDIKLGNLGAQDGLYAKDAGWLDIRGTLTISSTLGQIYIRDAEITSNVFKDTINYTNDIDRTQSYLFFSSGILSVRNNFAQDMFIWGNQTAGLRDGAVNATDINIDGLGYTAASGAHGSFRSITGNNIQNGNIGIGWKTGGDGSISVDTGSTLTINGVINGVNGAASAGGSSLIYNVAGNLIQNGTIASGVGNVTKTNMGDVRLNSANSFGGNVYIEGGTLTVANLGALSSNGYTQVETNGTLQFDLGNETSSTFNETIYMNGTSYTSQEATVRVVSGNVTLNDVEFNPNFLKKVATFQTNSGTSLTVDSSGSTWHTDAGVRFNTASNSTITTSTNFYHTGILKDGAGLLHLYGSNIEGGVRAAAGSVVFHANSDTGEDGELAYIYGYNSGVSSGASFVLQAASNNEGVGIALGNFNISGNGDTSNGYSGAIHNAVGDNDVGTVTLVANAKIFSANYSILSIGSIISDEGSFNLNLYTDSSGTIPTLLTSPVTFVSGTIYSGTINSSVGVVTKNGAGSLILNGDSSALSSVNPNIILNAGVTLVETANGLRGTNGITRVNAGASLVMNSTNAVVGTVQLETSPGFGLTPQRTATLRSLTFNGASNSNADIVLLGAGPATIGKIQASTTATSAGIISATSGAGVNFYVDAGRLNVSGDIASTVGAVSKYGVGTTLGISGHIDTTSNLNVVEGTLALSGTAANLNVSVSSGATLQINANNVFYNSVSGRSTVVDVASGGNLILGTTGTVTDTIYNLTGSGTIQLLNASVLNVLQGNFAGGVNSTGELIKDQVYGVASTLLLTSDSTYQGGTTVREGVLNVANTGSLTSNATVQSGGILVVNGQIRSNLPLSIGGNVTVQNGGELKGSGSIAGNVNNSGDVGPGNSPGILTVSGDYNSSAGWLNLELADHNGVAGTSYDQLRVGGEIDVANTLSVDYSTINFVDFGGFASVRGDVFQVIADLAGNARPTLNKFDLVHYVTAEPPNNDRVLFDHSTGRAYGTSLIVGTGTFRDYGVTANQKEIGRALWMESISYDKSTLITPDENFASTAINPAAAAAKTGIKAFILTSNADLGAGEEATDLGLAAVGVLIAPNAATALDALSPEAYAGIADQGTKVARNFVRQTFVVRHRDGATDDWDFEVGYANDELTSKGTSGYNSYATKSSQITLSASRTLGKEFAVTVAIGSDDGKVTAQNFDTKVKTGTVGLGLTYTPESKIGRFDIAAALSAADWDSSRGGALASEDGQHSVSAGARFTLAPIATNGVTISPYVGVIYSRSRVKGFTESGVDGTVQLEVDDFKQQSLQSELGLTVAYQLSPQMVLTGLASWEHEFRSSGQTTLDSQFIEAGVDDTRFTVNSNGFGTNLYRIGLSLRYDITALSSASISANAILGKGVDTGRELRANYSVRF